MTQHFDLQPGKCSSSSSSTLASLQLATTKGVKLCEEQTGSVTSRQLDHFGVGANN
jgi:hypothetical protein